VRAAGFQNAAARRCASLEGVKTDVDERRFKGRTVIVNERKFETDRTKGTIDYRDGKLNSDRVRAGRSFSI